MRKTTLSPQNSLKSATISNIASDKSLSHRAVIFAFLSDGESKIRNFLFGEDTLNTLKIAMQLGMQVCINSGGVNGVRVKNIAQILRMVAENPQNVEISLQRDKNGILEPNEILDCGNAGTAIRLYLGLLSAQEGRFFVLTGDKYLCARPMKRVIAPLENIGAKIYARAQNLAPICVLGQGISHFCYHSEISSAQVKSAMILAGLNARSNKRSEFSEISLSRDHSERMLRGMGADLESKNGKIFIAPLKSPLNPLDLSVPSDPSSAFYFAVLALILDIEITIKNMLLNKTRIQAFEILREMGASVEFEVKERAFEDIGDVKIAKNGALKAIEVSENIAWLIDEIPALGVIFAFASGKSVVKNASELRTKESDRIKATIENLAKFGVECEEFEDGFSVVGGFKTPRKKVAIDSYGDHRIAMSFALFGALCEVEVLDSACIDVSFPNFLEIIAQFMQVKNTESEYAN